MKIAVLGAGNGGFATTFDLTLQGHTVNLYEGFTPDILEGVDQIKAIGILGEKTIQPNKITVDIPDAIEDTDLIIVVTPALGHAFYAEKLSPHLHGGERIILTPGHTLGALNFNKTLTDNHAPEVLLGELDTLPYVARKKSKDLILITHKWKTMFLAALPSSKTKLQYSIYQKLYPDTKIATNILETGLNNQGAVMHAVGMILNAGWIESENMFRFYYDGFTPTVSKMAEKIDRERLSILKALGLPEYTLEELFFVGGFLPKRTDFYHAVAKSEANKPINAPTTLTHRYIEEDILFGLVPMHSLAKQLEVSTPAITSLIELADALLNRRFFDEGLTLEKLNLQHLTKNELLNYVNHGVLPTK